jgi:hypothetical protein
MKPINQQNPKQEKYKLVTHGYSTHGDEKSQGNVVMYDHYDKSMSTLMSFISMA